MLGKRVVVGCVVGWLLLCALGSAGAGQAGLTQAGAVGPHRLTIGTPPQPGVPAPRAEGDARDSPPPPNPFTSMPSPPLAMNAGLAAVGEQDLATWPMGLSDGRLVVVALEGNALRAQHSSNGGASFSPAVLVAGGSGQPRIVRVATDHTAAGRVYLGWMEEDPGGAFRLAFARSDDMGATWNTPAALVTGGATAHGLTILRLSAGPGDSVAIAFWGEAGTHPYAMASSDAGATWNGPVRLDPGAPAAARWSRDIDVEIDGSATVHAAFVQNRGSGNRVFASSSTDAGMTWSAEVDLSAITPLRQSAANVDLQAAFDGSMLAAFWDSEGNDHLYVMRAPAGGGAYTTTANILFGGNDTPPIGPKVRTSESTGIAMALYTRVDSGYGDGVGPLQMARSIDNGASFTAPATLASNASDGNFPWFPNFDTQQVGTTWVLCWTDGRSDTTSGLISEVYCRSSTNDGSTWATEVRVDSDAAGAAGSLLGGVARNGTSSVLVAWADGRDSNSRSYDVYVDRSAASPLAFGVDAKIDDDLGTTAPNAFWFANAATDGVAGVYGAFAAADPGKHSEIYVRASTDGGYTFGPPVRASGVPVGTRINSFPVIAATPDGNVYLVYESQAPTLAGGAKQLRFNVSHDFGATWLASDQLLATLVQYASGHYGYYWNPATVVRALNGGTVFVAYSDGDDVFLARSTNAGTSFDFNKDIDQDTRDENLLPRLCVEGSQVVATFISPNSGFTVYSVWGTSSADGGTTFAPRVQLRPESSTNGVGQAALACGGSSAVAIWEDYRSGGGQLYSSRFDGATWSIDSALPGPAGAAPTFPSTRFADSGTVLVAWQSNGEIWVNRSTDGGATFPSFQRLDDGTPVPEANSFDPLLASDGAGNAWVSWLDQSAGFPEIVVRPSVDAGASFGGARRLGGKAVQGTASMVRFTIANAASLPGAAVLTWNEYDDLFFADAMLAVHDLDDLDRDQALFPADCSDAAPGVKAAPTEILGLTLAFQGSGVRFDWTSQDGAAGVDTAYDIAAGSVADVLSTGTYAGATCHVAAIAAPPYDEIGSWPAPGSASWYLVRGRNACGTGSFGDAGVVPDPRDALDLLACP